MISNSIPFVKFQATGNDFIIIDGREYNYSQIPVALMCDRKFGIGADGLMIIQNKAGFDFEMIYYNSDGNTSSMCGNGGRAISKWASILGIGGDTLHFWAPDGEHTAKIESNDIVRLKMNNVSNWQHEKGSYAVINTGSPHYINLNDHSVFEIPDDQFVHWAKEIRYSDTYKKEGINVNNVSITNSSKLLMRTYERGVEGETLSCGTGVTAAALTCALENSLQNGEIRVQTRGGELSVEFEKTEKGFENIWLVGPAKLVFSGNYTV